jgi:hypothetical protein
MIAESISKKYEEFKEKDEWKKFLKKKYG